MCATVFKIGESIGSKTGVYTLTKQLQECVWLATYGTFSPSSRVVVRCIQRSSRLTACLCSSNQKKDKVVLKSIRHFRLRNERDVLLRFQSKTPYIRPLLDEIEDPPAIILRYLEDDLLQSSNRRRLSRSEVKFVARRVLEALEVLHSEGFVHTGSTGQFSILEENCCLQSSDRYQAEQRTCQL